jgi:hypothetical protein
VLYGYPDLPWDMAGAVLAVSLFLVLMATVGWPMEALAGLTLRAPHLVRRTFRFDVHSVPPPKLTASRCASPSNEGG